MERLDEARDRLREHFGFAGFLPGQEPAIRAILDGRDALVIMPTGGGKSLCYQLPALVLDGITVVVSPLIALMKDQVDALVARGIRATAINSSLSDADLDERLDGLARGEYRLVYIAPERFRSERFTRILAPLSIALFAIDEAHCISQWGHDFRPDYLRLRSALAELGQPPVVALTATATPDVREDIVAQLGLGSDGREAPEVFVHGFARPNLMLGVCRVSGRDEKLQFIGDAVRRLRSGIVYCATRKNVERLAGDLRKAGVEAIAYHAGMKDGDRRKAQDSFMAADHPVVIATNAFGMGIDRPDLRFLIHHDLPGSIEAYYQEAGRAGRDGEAAYCDLLFNYADVRTQEFFLEGANPPPEVIQAVYAAIAAACTKGPAALAEEQIASRLPGKVNGMAVGTALVILDRAGVIRRSPGTEDDTTLFDLTRPPPKASDLPIDFAALAEKRRRDQQRLSRILRYATAPSCRHRFILDYFGDAAPPSVCADCDNCRGRGRAAARPADEEETVIVQKALSCVARMNGRYGRGRVTQVLTGSAAKEVTAAGLDRLTTYGLLADEGSEYVWALLDALIEAGCIEVSRGEYPVLSLTELGGEVMRLRTTVNLRLPSRRQRPVPGERDARRRASPAADDAPYDAGVFAALKQWRRETATALGGVPAYLIFSDRTLRDLARALPADEAALQRVRGVGPAKLERHGAAVLEIIRDTPRQAPDA
jgi:ATP-dependent DNA helicase RecQ